MHDRISVNNLCFTADSLAQDVQSWRSLGASQVGILCAKMKAEGWENSVRLLTQEGFTVATMVHPFLPPAAIEGAGSIDNEIAVNAAQQDMLRTLTAAEVLGARTVYTTTGWRGALDWEDAALAFASAIAPCREFARNAGIELLTEPTPALYADAHIAHSLRDNLALAEIVDLGVLIDIFSCWTESGLQETIKKAAPRCHLVQVSDYVLGDRALSCRAVPGDGSIPLERIIGWILDAGFTGTFDLELLGPRIDAEGQYEAMKRSGDVLGEMLVRLGV